MPGLAEQLRHDLVVARKAQDRAGTLLLSTTLADVKNRQIELRRELTDEDVVEVLRRGIKRRREAVELYERGGREDLAARERAEAAALAAYLPAAVEDAELRAAVRDAIAGGATALGAVMGAVLPRFRGRAEGARVSAIAREELAARG